MTGFWRYLSVTVDGILDGIYLPVSFCAAAFGLAGFTLSGGLLVFLGAYLVFGLCIGFSVAQQASSEHKAQIKLLQSRYDNEKLDQFFQDLKNNPNSNIPLPPPSPVEKTHAHSSFWPTIRQGLSGFKNGTKVVTAVCMLVVFGLGIATGNLPLAIGCLIAGISYSVLLIHNLRVSNKRNREIEDLQKDNEFKAGQLSGLLYQADKKERKYEATLNQICKEKEASYTLIDNYFKEKDVALVQQDDDILPENKKAVDASMDSAELSDSYGDATSSDDEFEEQSSNWSTGNLYTQYKSMKNQTGKNNLSTPSPATTIIPSAT